MERSVVHPLEAPDGLRGTVFGDLEAVLRKIGDRPSRNVHHAGEQFDVLDVDPFDRIRAVDEDDVLGAAAVGEEGGGAQVGQGGSVEDDRLHPGRLVEGGDPFFAEEEFQAFDLIAVGSGDLEHGPRALEELFAGARLDESGAEALAAAVDGHLVRGDDLAVLQSLDAHPVFGRMGAEVQFDVERGTALAQDLPAVEREGDRVEVADRVSREADHAYPHPLVPRRHEAQQPLAAGRCRVCLGQSREGLENALAQRLPVLQVGHRDRLVDDGEPLAEDVLDLEPDLDIAGSQVAGEDERDAVRFFAAVGG